MLKFAWKMIDISVRFKPKKSVLKNERSEGLRKKERGQEEETISNLHPNTFSASVQHLSISNACWLNRIFMVILKKRFIK